jgi:hypothetical protein
MSDTIALHVADCNDEDCHGCPPPTGWLTLAREVEPMARLDWKWDQHARTLRYLQDRAEREDPRIPARAAAILLAGWDAPEAEQRDGIRINTALEGEQVKCRDCHRKWHAIPEDPFYDATTKTDGLCFACVLIETRTTAAVPVIEGVVVKKRPRRAVKAAES